MSEGSTKEHMRPQEGDRKHTCEEHYMHMTVSRQNKRGRDISDGKCEHTQQGQGT